jgi:glutaredoxin
MEYALFSYPNCQKCGEVKGYLEKKEIKYKEINAGIGEGRMKFREFYSQNKDRIQRENDGTILLPILLREGEIIQGLEKIISSLN